MAESYEPRRMTGRCASGAERDRGRLYHAVPAHGHGWTKALCGAQPGRRGNGWSDCPGAEVTCPGCLRSIPIE